MSYSRTRPCSICGTEFEAGRGDANLCSAKCRKAASRQKEALDKTYQRAVEAIRSLEEYIKSNHRLKYDALRRLQQLARDSSASVQEHGGQRHIYQAGNVTGIRIAEK